MPNADELLQRNAALQDRVSSLSAAVLRISTSLDVGTVLHEAVSSARALTGARYGVITTIDDSGKPEEFVSSGFSPEEHESMRSWSDGLGLFEHFRDLTEPLRLRDLPGYVRSLGYATDLMLSGTFQGAPMRLRGTHLGNFFLAGKEGEEQFTSEDEELLVLFATQAAAAIANARVHQQEQRARADLEALVDTSPIGVAVFNARAGRLVSVNQEARRIVAGLLPPDLSPGELLKVLRYRRADGREFSVDEAPLSPGLSTGEIVRGEEMVLSVPDGPSVTTLINATPIHGKDDNVDSVVITMQDLEPLRELERQRTEFLSLVSHELRAPLTSIKGSTTTVLRRHSDLDPAESLQFFGIIDQQADHMDGLINDLLDAGRIETGSLSVAPQPTEVSDLVDRARRTFQTGGARHVIRIDLAPDLPFVMADRQRIVQVLNNLFSNASRHSPESSPIRVSAAVDGVHVVISVSDEGRGVPPDLLPHLFEKYTGLRRSDREHGVRGHGLGLAICRGLVEAHGGRIRADSDGLGRGTCVTFTLPVADHAEDSHTSDRAPSRHGSFARNGKTRILVVDDDPEALRYMREALTRKGYLPIVTGDPQAVSHLIKTRKPHLILLDLILPGTDGIDLMERLPEMADLPVVFISGYGRDETIARALDLGAADYIVKPFSSTELVARVRAALRKHTEPEPFLVRDLAIHYDRHRVTLAGQEVKLTATEYHLLRALSANAGRVSTYDYLLRQVWRGREAGDPKLVRAFVKRLRNKLGDDPAEPAYIFNERGFGYRMISSKDV